MLTMTVVIYEVDDAYQYGAPRRLIVWSNFSQWHTIVNNYNGPCCNLIISLDLSLLICALFWMVPSVCSGML